MKIYGIGDETITEITKLIDNVFTQDMQAISGADKEYCFELIGKTAARLKEHICLYIDLKQEMCNRIIES